MEDKGNKIKIEAEFEKLNWETPILIILDKGKTEGGFTWDTGEGASYVS